MVEQKCSGAAPQLMGRCVLPRLQYLTSESFEIESQVTSVEVRDTVSEEEVMRGNLERCSLSLARAHLCIKILKSRVEDVMAEANSEAHIN